MVNVKRKSTASLAYIAEDCLGAARAGIEFNPRAIEYLADYWACLKEIDRRDKIRTLRYVASLAGSRMPWQVQQARSAMIYLALTKRGDVG